jgi:hypothetical protein
MHPLVRDLYRRVLHVGKDYPGGLAYVRQRAKGDFARNAGLTEERDILAAVHRGRWWVNEMVGVVQLRKYRAMAQRYGRGTAPAEAAAAAAELEARHARGQSPPPGDGAG